MTENDNKNIENAKVIFIIIKVANHKIFKKNERKIKKKIELILLRNMVSISSVSKAE